MVGASICLRGMIHKADSGGHSFSECSSVGQSPVLITQKPSQGIRTFDPSHSDHDRVVSIKPYEVCHMYKPWRLRPYTSAMVWQELAV